MTEKKRCVIDDGKDSVVTVIYDGDDGKVKMRKYDYGHFEGDGFTVVDTFNYDEDYGGLRFVSFSKADYDIKYCNTKYKFKETLKDTFGITWATLGIDDMKAMML